VFAFVSLGLLSFPFASLSFPFVCVCFPLFAFVSFFADLIMTATLQVLATFQQAVRISLKQCTKLVTLAGPVEHIRKERSLPESHAAHCSQYSIEMLQLSC
jgi:hypothetical protein